MSQSDRMVLFGAFFLAAGLVIWYGAYHPPMAYQRAKIANPTPAGLRRRRIAVVVIVVMLTAWGVLLGWAMPG
jgi:predicted transporter